MPWIRERKSKTNSATLIIHGEQYTLVGFHSKDGLGKLRNSRIIETTAYHRYFRDQLIMNTRINCGLVMFHSRTVRISQIFVDQKKSLHSSHTCTGKKDETIKTNTYQLNCPGNSCITSKPGQSL